MTVASRLDRTAAKRGWSRALRRVATLRCVALLSFALLAACASDDVVRSGLDDRGRTWVTLDTTVTLARPAPRFSNAARDYLYVAPVQTSTSGTRRHYLWVGLGTTVDRGWPWAAPSDAATLILTVDGVPVALPLADWDAEGGAQLYRTPAPVYRVRRASVSLDELERIATASEIAAQIVASDGSVARYDLWDGQWSDWTQFVVGADSASAERSLGVENSSREGFCTATVRRPCAEVREPAAVYRVRSRPWAGPRRGAN